jgi:tungstate transport system ATP-binding protein
MHTHTLPIVAEGLRVVRDGRVLIDGIDLEIVSGDRTTVIIGPNGAGKSLLMRILAGLMVPDAGALTWAGVPADRARALRVGVVFQRPVLLRRSAVANIEYVLKVAGVPAHERRSQAAAALQEAGLSDVAHSPARLLSGGEQQRLSLARALALRPGVLMLDEPTANVDPASTAAIERRIGKARDAGTSVVLVTQDLGQARRLASEVVFMHQGRILERTLAAQFFTQPQTREAAMFLKGEIVL